MQRRDFLKLTAAVGMASALPLWSRAVFAASRPALPIPSLLAALVTQHRHLSRAEVRCHGVVGVLVGILADGNADGENGRLHVVFLKHRERVLVVTQIAVVERENDRFFGQR